MTRETPSIKEVQQFKLGLIVGHTKKDQGAVMKNKVTEYQYNSQVAEACKKLSDEHLKVEVIYRDGIGISGAYAKADKLKCDYVIELHFNAFNKKATGTETLCSNDDKDYDFALSVHTMLCKLFDRGGSSRGVKKIPRSGRGGQSCYSYPNGKNCLVEPFFGDAETELAMKKQELYAEELFNHVKVLCK